MSHIFAVLDTVGEAEAVGVKQGLYGKDVMVWGGNGEHEQGQDRPDSAADYQLGNGKRSSLAVPQHIPQLIQRAAPAAAVAAREAALSSGTVGPESPAGAYVDRHRPCRTPVCSCTRVKRMHMTWMVNSSGEESNARRPWWRAGTLVCCTTRSSIRLVWTHADYKPGLRDTTSTRTLAQVCVHTLDLTATIRL
jgi:hypothetical protein